MTNKHRHDDHETQADHREGFSGMRDTASRAYETTVEKASHTLDSSRDLAADAARRTVAGIESSPLGVVVGGLALGLVAGALLPRSARERELLAPVGAKLGERARTAFAAAQEAGKSELEGLGISRDAAKSQVRSLFDGVLKAATAAGQAAVKSTSPAEATAKGGMQA